PPAREPPGEVVQADPDPDRHAETQGLAIRRQTDLGDRHRTRPEARPARSMGGEPEEVWEAEEPDAETRDVDETDGDQLAPGPVDNRFLDRFGRVREHVEQE